jgi:hypothetical protein
MCRRTSDIIRTLSPTKKLPNSQRILQLETSAKWRTCGMLRHCLIHPVAPLLSLLAPLFRPFFSPVRGLPDAAMLRLKSLKYHCFCAAFRHRAGGKGVFPPVIPAETGERTLRCRREEMGIQDREKSRCASKPASLRGIRCLPATTVTWRCRRRRWCRSRPCARSRSGAGSAGRRPSGRCPTAPRRQRAEPRQRRRSCCG